MNKFQSPGKVKTINASVLNPELAGLRIIVNVVGQDGKFESELDKLLAKKWANTRTRYKAWYAEQQNFKLGCIDNVAVASDIWIVNLLAFDKDNRFSADGLNTAVKKLAALAKYENASVHCSSLVTHDAPGLQEALLKDLVENGIHCFFYQEQDAK
jgi:hypothetical protein